MSNLVTQELAIVVSVKIQNPPLLNKDFLLSETIPSKGKMWGWLMLPNGPLF